MEAGLAVALGLRFDRFGSLGEGDEVNSAEREQIKLRAAALDRVSTACTTIGVLTPLAGTFFSGNAAAPADWKLFVACFLYLGGALILHYAALFVLDGLEE
ncbi:hypothetical protein IVA94_14670 [Bradyrhizobium sp. 156]|nr:hypothetical protein [Bradyrhizobium sp. 156]